MRLQDGSERPKRQPIWLLRRTDQAVVAILLAAGIIAMGLYWLHHTRQNGRFIEIDHQPPLKQHFVVDVNAAEWPELTQIPEIGETLARRIVESRRQNGPFRDLDDLQRVRGIGPRTLEKMRPYLSPIADGDAVAGP